MSELTRTKLAADVCARLRAGATEVEVPTIGTADSLHEALFLDGAVPAFYFILPRTPSQVLAGGRRRVVVGNRKQIITVRISIAVVTQSFAPREDGQQQGWDWLEYVADSLNGWKTVEMLRRFIYLDSPFVMRSPDLTRTMHEVQLEGTAEVFTTPVAP
jgi:hypothetical protein